jgi:hypothetical protein
MRCPTLLFTALCVSVAQAQCEGNLFFNGDLDGIEGEATIALGWTAALSTADLNDENGPLNCTPDFGWIGAPVASPTGGTGQSMTETEAISQAVPTISGATYSVCFDYANLPIFSDAPIVLFDDPWGVIVKVNGVTVFTAPLLPDAYVWSQACASFVANSSTSVVLFKGAGGGEAYGGIDGLCMLLDKHTATAELSQDRVAFFPNPALDHVQVRGNNTVLRATATSTSGQTVALPTGGNRIEVGTLEPGLYMLQCWFAGSTAPVCERVLVQGAQ